MFLYNVRVFDIKISTYYPLYNIYCAIHLDRPTFLANFLESSFLAFSGHLIYVNPKLLV